MSLLFNKFESKYLAMQRFMIVLFRREPQNILITCGGY